MLGPEFRIYIVHPYLDASAPPVFYPSSNSCQDRLPIVPSGQAAAIYALLIQFRNPSYMGDIATLRSASDERAPATLCPTGSSELLMRCLARETLVATNSQIVYATIACEGGRSGSGGSRAVNGYFVLSGINRRETTDRAHDPQARSNAGKCRSMDASVLDRYVGRPRQERQRARVLAPHALRLQPNPVDPRESSRFVAPPLVAADTRQRAAVQLTVQERTSSRLLRTSVAPCVRHTPRRDQAEAHGQ